MAADELWKSLGSYKGPQLWVCLAIVVIIALSLFARHYLAPGTARLAASEKDRDDAVGILKAQLKLSQEDLKTAHAENETLDHRVRQLETANGGFEWMKTNPAALRLLADQIEAQQRAKH